MSDFVRCQHDGITLVRLPEGDHRESVGDDARLAFKRAQSRKWLAQERERQRRGLRRNVIRFGAAAK